LEEAYSNNVGFYRSAFYVFPSATAPVPVAPPSRGHRALNMGDLMLSAHHVKRGERIDVATNLHVGASPIPGGTTVIFYDGDPAAKGKAFDVERVAHLRAGDTHRVAVPFRSDRCGMHRLFAIEGKGTAFEVIRKSGPVMVECHHDREDDEPRPWTMESLKEILNGPSKP
jgi:predicted metal-dependent enzyme (double-stranded beta helix superfamily)